jgi:predicted transcriptional regulator
VPTLPDRRQLTEITADIVSAYVGNNAISVTDLPDLIANVSGSVTALGQPQTVEGPILAPAVKPKRSVFPDHIVCLEDGKKFKSLKRHLSAHGMTPDEYRRKWGLPADYPMVAPNYSAARSQLAKDAGLGHKANAKRRRSAKGK